MELHDVHAVDVDAPPEAVWAALAPTLTRAFASRRARALARALGCRDRDATGAPLAPGSTVPGFVVARSDPPRTLVLEGRHRFAAYALTVEIEPRTGGARVAARTDATFPGLHGALYRVVVLGPFHAPVTRRILRGLRRRAERLSTRAPSSS